MATLSLDRSRFPWPKRYVVLIILVILCLTTLTNGQDQEQAPLIQTEGIPEWRETIITMGVNTSADITPPRPCRSWAVEKDKKALLKRLRKPKNAEDYTKHHIRHRLLMAIDGFLKYGEKAEGGIQRKRDMFGGLSQVQAAIVNKAASYQQKLTSASLALQQNARIAEDIADHAMQYYNIKPAEVAAFSEKIASEGQTSDHTSVTQGLKHFVRDWSVDGEEERDAVIPRLVETLELLFPKAGRGEKEVRVLIPGSGVGRLAHDVDELGGFEVHSNEYSAYMNICYRYITSLTTLNSRTIYPYADSWSHQPSTSELLYPITIPSFSPSANRIIHHEGDFTTLFKNGPKFSVIITLFFIDTARNLLTYFETIRDILEPGGIWINLGPLFYGSAPMVELSLDEIVSVVEEMGFEFMEVGEMGELGEESLEGKVVRGWKARYGLSPRSLTRNSYQVQFWVGRTPGGV